MVPPRTRRRGHLDVRRGTLARPKKEQKIRENIMGVEYIFIYISRSKPPGALILCRDMNRYLVYPIVIMIVCKEELGRFF